MKRTVKLMTRTLLGALPAALALSLAPAAAETFRYAHVGDVNTLDPYQFDETVQLGFLGNIYEPLVGRGTPAMQLEPALATSWELVEPTRWRFHLRKGVKFHNGNDFTAEDVIFSAERARHPNSQVGYRYGGVTEIVAVDDYTVDMVSENPNPFIINNFFYLYIMDKEWAEEHETVIPAAMGAAGEAYANLHANGTGPFKVVRRVPDVETVVEPFDGWWGEKTHNITQAIFRPISSDPTRVAALLSGELDLIYPVPIQDVARIDGNDGTYVLSGPENRSIFLILDLWRDELLYSDIKGKNPFADTRVRKAVYQAIDIEAIIRTVMRGQATPALGAALSPTVYGYPHHLERHPFDLDAAKALLGDAGYADGFSVTLDCPNDRYVNDEEVCQAIVSMLAKAGIEVALNAQTKGLHFGKIAKQGGWDTSFALVGFGPGNFDAASIHNLILRCRSDAGGAWNIAGFCDPEMDKMYDTLVMEVDPAVRDPLLEQVWDRVHEEVLYIPLHLQNLAWGVRDGVTVVQRPDNVVMLNHVTMQ